MLGENPSAQLGRGYKSDFEPPAGGSVPGLSNIVSLELGYQHICAKQFALIFIFSCWGGNDNGETGVGFTSDTVFTPQPISGLRTAARDVSLGYSATCAVLIDDSVQCWGSDLSGLLGNGFSGDSVTPVDAIGATNIAQIDLAFNRACAVTNDGEVMCWGANNYAGIYGVLGTDSSDSSVLTAEYVLNTTLTEGPIDIDDVLDDIPSSGGSPTPYEYGDAPDTDPLTSQTIDAYPGVIGRYPTLTDTAVSGPRHAGSALYFLGNVSTLDAPIDDDGVPNLNHAANAANLDIGDDGWLNRNNIAQVADCATTTLRVRVRRSISATNPATLYLNAWFDGNRDGDWRDTRNCERGGPGYEWIVQNHKIDPLPAVGGFIDLDVTTSRMLVNSPTNPAWVRFSLSDRIAVTPTLAGAMPDGRGPDNVFLTYGETEDYLWDPVTPVERYGEFAISKRINPAGPFNVGDTLDYIVEVTRTGGTQLNVPALVADVLPAQTEFVSGVLVNELSPAVNPASAVHQANYGGPNGRVIWAGTMTAGARFRLRYTVRVESCPTSPITNTANLFVPGAGSVQTATHSLTIPCTPPPPPVITLSKQLVGAVGSTAPPASPPLNEAVFLLTLNASNLSAALPAAIEDAVPGSMTIEQISASRGGAVGVGTNTLRWVGAIGPSQAAPQVWVRARLTNLADCDIVLTNTARWAARNTDGAVLSGVSSAVPFDPACAAPTLTPTAQATATPTPRATYTPVPVATNTSVPLPTDAPPNAPTNTPAPVATNTSVPLPTVTPRPTNTPVPAATNTSVPLEPDGPPNAPTNTPVPRATNTSVPLIPNNEEAPLRNWLPLAARN